MIYSNWICQKCGSVMNMKVGYGYGIYWQCPNGCNQNSNFKYTSSATNINEKIEYKDSSNSQK